MRTGLFAWYTIGFVKVPLNTSLEFETKVLLDALCALQQLSTAAIITRALNGFVEALQDEDRRVLADLQRRAMETRRSSPSEVPDGIASYEFPRLCFKHDVIMELEPDESFRVITPVGSFEMTRADFERDFKNVAVSKSYDREGGIYHYPKVPAKAERYRLR
ncbi:hypothetical protein SBA4_6920005 [Candidatus Sulfopaludibacter sp. SbA4]|nr:hypothetical protein SBA4_6920005 [Candidatus Sulfopaludibacter sp. SbA4]